MNKTLSKLIAVMLMCSGFALATEQVVNLDLAYQYCTNPTGVAATLYEKWTNAHCSGTLAYLNNMTKRTSRTITGVTCTTQANLQIIEVDALAPVCQCIQKWGPNTQVTVNPNCITDINTVPWNKLYDDCGGI